MLTVGDLDGNKTASAFEFTSVSYSTSIRSLKLASLSHFPLWETSPTMGGLCSVLCIREDLGFLYQAPGCSW